MADEDRFNKAVVLTLSKRAANRCSNPTCQAVTSGPADDVNKSVNVGVAAHIFGANPGSARYDPGMASTERSAITNAIWLCANCHKMIDDDPAKYPAGLMFIWQREHEKQISERVGKAGAEMRQQYETRHLEEFGRLSYLAERIILEKDDYWEFRLISEVLRFEMQPVLRRWRALKNGLYMKPVTRLSVREFTDWMADRMSEVSAICEAFSQLMNFEFQRAWGAPGVPGDEAEIVSTCRLYAEMCSSALIWEEQVRFVSTHDVYDELLDLLKGIAGGLIDEAAKLPQFMADTFGGEDPSGTYEFKLVLALPDGWVEKISQATQTAAKRITAGVRNGDITY